MISRQTTEFRGYLAITLSLATIALTVSIETLSINSAAVAQLAPVDVRGHLRQDPMQEISLTLSSTGFNPQEVRPQSGRFLLSIDNRSGASDLVFRVSRADGTLMREFRMSGAGGDWTEAFDLSAGTYTLSETSHSTWACTIIVQGNGVAGLAGVIRAHAALEER